MQSRSWEIQERAARFGKNVARLCEQVTVTPSSQRIVRNLTTASAAMQTGYRDTCASSSPERFILGISAVARHAKRATACLVLLLELNHVSIEEARRNLREAVELLLESASVDEIAERLHSEIYVTRFEATVG